MSRSKLAVVTGGAGFIGSHIVRGLLEENYAVRVLDNLSGPKSWRRLSDISAKLEMVEGDVRDAETLKRVMASAEAVFHLAALVSVPESVQRPAEYHEVDATGTLRVLQSAVDAGVRRFVYASTSAIYGDGAEQPKTETMRGQPISPYGIAKYAGEMYVAVFARLHALESISLRYFNVFGPGQDPKSQYGAAVPNIVSRLLAGQRPLIFGDGEQTRDFCHIGNIVRANMLALKAPRLSGEVVNIGCGVRVSVNQIVREANEALGTRIEAVHEPPRSGDVRDSLADISAAKALLNYEPVIQFRQGLRESIEWYRNSR
jgi:nucleoside-diphosphate-sugar epimerase